MDERPVVRIGGPLPFRVRSVATSLYSLSAGMTYVMVHPAPLPEVASKPDTPIRQHKLRENMMNILGVSPLLAEGVLGFIVLVAVYLNVGFNPTIFSVWLGRPASRTTAAPPAAGQEGKAQP